MNILIDFNHPIHVYFIGAYLIAMGLGGGKTEYRTNNGVYDVLRGYIARK